MLAKVWTCAVVGLEGELVQVEVDIARQGLVQFNIVGLPDAAVQEARERVRAAVRNSGFIFPYRRVTAWLRICPATNGGYDVRVGGAAITGTWVEGRPAVTRVPVSQLAPRCGPRRRRRRRCRAPGR